MSNTTAAETENSNNLQTLAGEAGEEVDLNFSDQLRFDANRENASFFPWFAGSK